MTGGKKVFPEQLKMGRKATISPEFTQTGTEATQQQLKIKIIK